MILKKIKRSDFFKYGNVISVVLSLLLSGYAIYSSNKLAVYQVEQERMPSVVCLNQDIGVNFEIDYHDRINAYSSIEDLKVKVYNLGAATAQNCELSWDTESVKNACVNLKGILAERVDIHSFESEDFFEQNFSLYDYIYEFKKNNLQSIWYFDNELEDFIEHEFDISPAFIPYIMPVTTKETSASIKLPSPLAVMLMEMGNRGIREAVDIKLNINYQDMAGKKYNEKFKINIKGDGIQNNVLDKGECELREKSCEYAISAEKTIK